MIQGQYAWICGWSLSHDLKLLTYTLNAKLFQKLHKKHSHHVSFDAITMVAKSKQ